MFSLKHSVRPEGTRVETLLGLMVLREAFAFYGLSMTVTSLTDGAHLPKSLHYKGLAADIRSRDIPEDLKKSVIDLFNQSQNGDYDLIIEGAGTLREHFHLEWDPER